MRVVEILLNCYTFIQWITEKWNYFLKMLSIWNGCTSQSIDIYLGADMRAANWIRKFLEQINCQDTSFKWWQFMTPPGINWIEVIFCYFQGWFFLIKVPINVVCSHHYRLISNNLLRLPRNWKSPPYCCSEKNYWESFSYFKEQDIEHMLFIELLLLLPS